MTDTSDPISHEPQASDDTPHTDDGPHTDDPHVEEVGLRRSQRIGIVIALIVIASVGLVAGAGLSPGDVSESIEQRLSGDPEPDLDHAVVVAADASDDYTVELLLVPTDRGAGECTLVRSTGPGWEGNEPESPMTRCWFDGPARPWSDADFQLIRPKDRFGLLIEVPLGPVGEGSGAIALVGAVYEDVRAIRAEFGDGSEYTFNLVTDDGWFVVILPDGVVDIDRVDGGLVNGVVALELVDADGRVMATATPNSNWF